MAVLARQLNDVIFLIVLLKNGDLTKKNKRKITGASFQLYKMNVSE